MALIHHHLCQREGGLEGEEKQTDRVKAKVKQLGEMNVSDGKERFISRKAEVKRIYL